jgi:hypothetical protein
MSIRPVSAVRASAIAPRQTRRCAATRSRAQVVDGVPAQTSGPRERVEHRELGAVLDTAGELDGLLGPRVGHRDALDPDRRDVRGELTEDGRS